MGVHPLPPSREWESPESAYLIASNRVYMQTAFVLSFQEERAFLKLSTAMITIHEVNFDVFLQVLSCRLLLRWSNAGNRTAQQGNHILFYKFSSQT